MIISFILFPISSRISQMNIFPECFQGIIVHVRLFKSWRKLFVSTHSILNVTVKNQEVVLNTVLLSGWISVERQQSLGFVWNLYGPFI